MVHMEYCCSRQQNLRSRAPSWLASRRLVKSLVALAVYEVQGLLIVKHRHPDYPITDQKEKIWTGDWADHSVFRQYLDESTLANQLKDPALRAAAFSFALTPPGNHCTGKPLTQPRY